MRGLGTDNLTSGQMRGVKKVPTMAQTAKQRDIRTWQLYD